MTFSKCHAATLRTFSTFCRDSNPVGYRALSHDSIFTPEEPLKELSLDLSMSQENVSDKVRNLQVVLMQILHLSVLTMHAAEYRNACSEGLMFACTHHLHEWQ